MASKILFIIDDIHFADDSSLKHLLILGSHSKCLLILAMKPPSNNDNDRPAFNTLQSISTDSRVYLRRLPGLELRHLATLGNTDQVKFSIIRYVSFICQDVKYYLYIKFQLNLLKYLTKIVMVRLII